MVRKVKVSRVGLTRCPACRSHIKVAQKLSETECPFCGESLVAVHQGAMAAAVDRAAGAIVRGRSSLIAGALMGAVAVGTAGCPADEVGNGGSGTGQVADVPQGTDTGGDDAGTATGGDSTGGDSTGGDVTGTDGTMDVIEMEPDIPVEPPYGHPPMDDVVEPEPDIPDQPLYGGPPTDDVEETEPEDTHVEEEDTSDPPVEPLYGAVPFDAGSMDDEDATEEGDTEAEDADDPPFEPLYGVPSPEPE